MRLVDLATGICKPLPTLHLHGRSSFASGQLPDGRVVCLGDVGAGGDSLQSAEAYKPPYQGPKNAVGSSRHLPALRWKRMLQFPWMRDERRPPSVAGTTMVSVNHLLCARLWYSPLTMPTGYCSHLCCLCETALHAQHAVVGCIIVAGDVHLAKAEVFDEALTQCFPLPGDIHCYLTKVGQTQANALLWSWTTYLSKSCSALLSPAYRALDLDTWFKDCFLG